MSKTSQPRWHLVPASLLLAVVGWTLFGAGCAPARISADVPIRNIQVETPKPDIPSELAAFSGVWAGEWTDGRDYRNSIALVVEQISSSNHARVTFGCGRPTPASAARLCPGAWSHTAEFSSGTLKVAETGAGNSLVFQIRGRNLAHELVSNDTGKVILWGLLRRVQEPPLAEMPLGRRSAADLATLQKRLEPHYRAHRPQDAGPFPAILLVPGCGGISPGRLRTAEQLMGDGYVVVFVDYISARGLQTACRGEVSAEEVAQDIRAASAHVRSLPYVRPAALGVVGWSWGGAAVLASLAGLEQDQEPPFAAAAAFYPVCSGLRAWKAKIPVLVLLGGQDDIAPPGLCQELVRTVGSGYPVEVRTYPEARHSFDASDLPPTMPSRAFPGKTVGFHAEAARQAWAEVVTMFDHQLRRSK